MTPLNTLAHFLALRRHSPGCSKAIQMRGLLKFHWILLMMPGWVFSNIPASSSQSLLCVLKPSSLNVHGDTLRELESAS
jgi:hypothetical protein